MSQSAATPAVCEPSITQAKKPASVLPTRPGSAARIRSRITAVGSQPSCGMPMPKKPSQLLGIGRGVRRPRAAGSGWHGARLPRGRRRRRPVADSPRVQPLRQRRVGVLQCRGEVRHARQIQPLAKTAVVEGVEELGRAADMRAADEDLRDGRGTEPGAERSADVATPVPCLVGDGVEVDGTERNAHRREELARRGAELAPFEREHHYWRVRIGDGLLDEPDRRLGRLGQRRGGRRHRRAASKRAEGVEEAIASSSSFIDSATCSKRAVER